jgi:hypothetical protein
VNASSLSAKLRKERSLGRAREWLNRAVFLICIVGYISVAHLGSCDQGLADEAFDTVPDIPRDKLVAWQPIASEMDSQFHHATSAMREQLGSLPRIAEVAYSNSKFNKMDEEFTAWNRKNDYQFRCVSENIGDGDVSRRSC